MEIILQNMMSFWKTVNTNARTELSILRMKDPCAVTAFAKMQDIPLDSYESNIN